MEHAPSNGHPSTERPSSPEILLRGGLGRALWIGGEPSHHLRAALLQKSLTLVPTNPSGVVAAAWEARALVIELPVPGLPLVDLERTVRIALDHGLPVAVVHAEVEDAEEVLPYYQATKELQYRLGLHDSLKSCYRDWQQLAEWVSKVYRGRAANGALVVSGDAPADPTALLLLRRAFADYACIEVEAVSGGKSGATVWVVRPGSEADFRRCPKPFVAKVGTIEKMRREESNYLYFVRDYVPWRNASPIRTDRTVIGAAQGLVVYDFVEKADPFARALQSRTPDELVTALFGHTLGCGWACATPVSRPMARDFEAHLKALRYSDALQAAAEAARAAAPELPDAATLVERVRLLPPVYHLVGVCHGDLHVGNLFVAGGSNDVLLIDFGSMSGDVPLVADFACCEVSIAFPSGDMLDHLGRSGTPSSDAAWLDEAYRYPLKPSAVPTRRARDRWVSQALRAVRAEVYKCESGPVPYAIAVATYLVRYASYDDHAALEDRALAYRLACRLIEAVRDELA